MEDVLGANANKVNTYRNAANHNKLFATQAVGEKWLVGGGTINRVKKPQEPFFIPNLSPKRHNISHTIANKTVTNFSMFSHRSSLPA
jgi:hypothetical protein